MTHQPWQQGHFDGLCGVYALINAIAYLCPGFSEDDCSHLFRFLIQAVGDTFPKAIVDGLDFDPLCDLAEHLPGHLKPRHDIRLIRPFAHETFERVDDFFDDLRPLVGARRVAIIGLGQPWDHWTVVTKVDPASFRLWDSYGLKRLPKFLFALDDRQGQIRLDCRETILIERV